MDALRPGVRSQRIPTNFVSEFLLTTIERPGSWL